MTIKFHRHSEITRSLSGREVTAPARLFDAYKEKHGPLPDGIRIASWGSDTVRPVSYLFDDGGDALNVEHALRTLLTEHKGAN